MTDVDQHNMSIQRLAKDDQAGRRVLPPGASSGSELVPATVPLARPGSRPSPSALRISEQPPRRAWRSPADETILAPIVTEPNDGFSGPLNHEDLPVVLRGVVAGRWSWGCATHDAAKASNLPSAGLRRPAGFEVPLFAGLLALLSQIRAPQVPSDHLRLRGSGHRWGHGARR